MIWGPGIFSLALMCMLTATASQSELSDSYTRVGNDTIDTRNSASTLSTLDASVPSAEMSKLRQYMDVQPTIQHSSTSFPGLVESEQNTSSYENYDEYDNYDNMNEEEEMYDYEDETYSVDVPESSIEDQSLKNDPVLHESTAAPQKYTYSKLALAFCVVGALCLLIVCGGCVVVVIWTKKRKLLNVSELSKVLLSDTPKENKISELNTVIDAKEVIRTDFISMNAIEDTSAKVASGDPEPEQFPTESAPDPVGSGEEKEYKAPLVDL